MTMQVEQSGYGRESGRFANLEAVGHAHLRARTNCADAAVLDDDHRIGNRRPVRAVDQQLDADCVIVLARRYVPNTQIRNDIIDRALNEEWQGGLKAVTNALEPIKLGIRANYSDQVVPIIDPD